jgi:hypothetical protein
LSGPIPPYAALVAAPEDPYPPPPDGEPWEVAQQYAGTTQTSTKAVIALVLAIGAYTPIVPFIGAILALFLSASAKRDIQSSGGRQTGLPLCTAATIISVVHLVFIGLLIVLVLAVLALPFSFS